MKLGKESALKKVRELFVSVSFGFKPLNHSQSVIQALLIGMRGGSLRLDPQFVGFAVQLWLMSSPERCLVATPGRGNGDYRQQNSLRKL
jgi:hypothetical protein